MTSIISRDSDTEILDETAERGLNDLNLKTLAGNLPWMFKASTMGAP
jgi:hypothetical protein